MTLQYWNAWVSPDSVLWRQFHSVTLKRPSRAGFLNLGTVDSLGWIILCCGDCPVHCRRFNSNPGFYVLNISSISPAATTKNVSWHCQMYSGGNPFPASPDENHWSRKRTTIRKGSSQYQWSYLGFSHKDKSKSIIEFISYRHICEIWF